MTPEAWRAWVRRRMGSSADDFEAGDLQFLADGPICDPLRIYCPAGRLSWAATKEREQAQIIGGTA